MCFTHNLLSVFFKSIGLTSSLDIILKTTDPATLSECTPTPVSQTKEIDVRPSQPVTDQKSTTRDIITVAKSTHSQSSDSSNMSDSTHLHSRSVDKSTSTAPCDNETSSQELNQFIAHTQSGNIMTGDNKKGHLIRDSVTSTSVDSSKSAYMTIKHCHDKLVTALLNNVLSVSGILLANEFISEEVHSKMLLPTATPEEKATDLVNALRRKIKLAPDQFQKLIRIFSEQACTRDIVPYLSPHVSCEKVAEAGTPQNTGMVVSTTQQYYVVGHMYTAWETLDPDDKIDLEARLLTDAEIIGVKFAHLCTKARDSFEERGIMPRILADTLMDLTVYKPGSSCHDIIPLFKEEGGTLRGAQSVRDIFHALRPHMSFFNYEILQFLIEGKGSDSDKVALSTYLTNFTEFCRRHVFEVPFRMYSNGHQIEGPKTKQRLHIKITEHFKAAILMKSAAETLPSIDDEVQANNVCSSKLGINLEDAKNIQRKLATILGLNPSSLFLDTISEGSIILTFLLPTCVSLAGLDGNPDIALLSNNGIHILCGPPGKPELKEFTPSYMIMEWSPPEYGCDSLTKYQLHYQKKSELETSQWQKLELASLECCTCLPELSDGCLYIFKTCAVSDVRILQYSNESYPIIVSAEGTLMNNIHKVILGKNNGLTSPFPSADPNTFAALLSTKGVISKENETQISLAPTPNEQATLLITAIERQINSAPQKFLDFLNALSEAKLSQRGDIAETLWSDYYDGVYQRYLDYLKFLYASLDKKQTSSDQWPPSATKKFFRLAMIETATVQRGRIEDSFVRMTITGKVDDILRQKHPIQLKDIFKETKGQRKVILLEGAPGCGKSTLSVYICKQWQEGNQFKLVILIRLRDPAIREAKGLADLLPCPDTTTAQQIAARMLANNCQDVLFILDGWDELPPNLQMNSIFHQLVQPKLPQSNPLCESTVIVTSRPIASGDLHQVVSSRVEILGFTAEELHQFFTECLKGDTEAVKTLLERIEENPEVAGSCYLPLNATILVHLFKSDRNTLPTTLYGIFSSLVLNCIKRHLKLRTQYKDVPIESLDQLPEFAKRPFSVLCQLAYDGVMEDKIIFTSLPPDATTLSLLQGVESFIGQQKAVSHNFIHLSIQELLAAWYIATQLPANEQVSKFNELFDKSRFIAVFKFYAAITKLKTPGIKDVIIKITRAGKKYLLVSLLHCLYEAQDPSLCESVTQQLQHGLDLRGTTLTPSDCLCIGYFLAHVCKVAAGQFRVNLQRCSIGDLGCKYLASGLHKYLDTDSAVTTLYIMNHNDISCPGFSHLSTLLKIDCLSLSNNNLQLKQDTVDAPFYKQLQSNTTLQELWLQGCGLNSQSAESLAEALTTNKHLKVLSLSDNALCDDGIQHLAHALRVNQGLKVLHLKSCGMTDVGLQCLVKSLPHNNVLNRLSVYNFIESDNPNRLTEEIVPVLIECLQNNHILTVLHLQENLRSSTASIEEAVNDVRKRNGLHFIEVTGRSIYMTLYL